MIRWTAVIVVTLASFLLVRCDNHIPYFVYQPSFHDSLVPEGQLKRLICQAEGLPPPEIQWFKDDVPLGEFGQDNMLELPHISQQDEGFYHCVAKNEMGAIMSDRTQLVVAYFKPQNKSSFSIRVKQGEAAVLPIPQVNSVPLPTAYWRSPHRNRLIGKKYVLTQDGRQIILNTDKSDMGAYEVNVTNSYFGRDMMLSGIVNLEVTDTDSPMMDIPPLIIIPPKDSRFKQGTTSAKLECIANARPLENLNIVWNKDGQPLSSTNLMFALSPSNYTLTLHNVSPTYSGHYQCDVHHLGEVVTASAYVSIEESPRILVRPDSETHAKLGQTILLPCEAKGNPTPTIRWFRNAELITLQNKFKVLSNGSLLISQLELQDSRVYQCEAFSDAGWSSTHTWLNVQVSSPIFLKAPQNVTSLQGKDAQLICDVAGSPQPTISWFFEGHRIEEEGRHQILESGELVITAVSAPLDQGQYTCLRSNTAGNISASAWLTILVRTQISGPPVHTKVILGSTAELQCKVSHDSSLPVVYTWLHGGLILQAASGGRIHTLEDGTLRIGQARNTDVGSYTCIVESAGGNDSRSARLDVIELPHPPTNVKASLATRAVNVSWSKPFDGNSQITGYVVQARSIPIGALSDDLLLPWITAQPNVSEDQRYVLLRHLKPAVSYQFRVSAVNGVGEGNPSHPTTTLTLPSEPPSGPPQGVVGGARSSTSIMLQWQPPTLDESNGELRGYLIHYKLAGYLGSPWVEHNVSNSAQHTYLLQDLIVWQNYNIQIAAYNDKGVGSYSDSIFIRTKEGVPQSPPNNVHVESLNSTAVRVWWSPPYPQLINGINLGYKIQAWSDSLPLVMVMVPPSPLDPLAEQSTDLTGLEKFETYNVSVLCFTSPGDGPASSPIVVTTKQDIPDQVQWLKFEEILDSSVKVKWEAPQKSNGVLLGYTLKYHVKDVPETTIIRNLSSSINTVVVDNLRAVTAYTFELFAWTEIGAGPSRSATIQSGIPPVLPDSPYKLAVSNIGPFSVLVQFTPGFDGNTSITRWTVEGQTRRDEQWNNIFEVSDPDAQTVLVRKLTPFTEYRLRLIASNMVGSSPPSEPTKWFQTIQAAPSHAPYNVTVRAVNALALRVRWTPLRQSEWFGIPRGYNITYHARSSPEEPKSILVEDYNANSFVLNKLEEFTEYLVSVQAYNDVGLSHSSPQAAEWTRDAVPSEGPRNVLANATSSTTIVVSWGTVKVQHQNGLLEGYKVYYGAKQVPFQYKIIEANNTFTTTLTELRKHTIYSIQVLAFSRIGDGVLSHPPLNVQTFEDVPGVPSNISFPDVSTSMARIIWDVPEEPNGMILGYKVSYMHDAEKSPYTKILGPTERTFKAFNLQPETYYTFTVTGKTAEGWGKTAAAKVYTTNNRESPQPPSAPHVSKSQVQARQITFTWTPGRDGFAPLRYYMVQVQEGGSGAPWKTWASKVDPIVTTYTIDNLKPFTSYKFRIQAVNDIGASGWSLESDTTTTLPAAPEHPPTLVMVTPYTTTSVRVSWEALQLEDWNGDTTSPAGYRVDYCIMSAYVRSDCPSSRAAGIDSTYLSLHNMEQNTNYEIRVYASNSQGDSGPSQPVTVFVGEAVPNGEPQSVKVEAISSTEVRVSWQPPEENLRNGEIMGYKIFYSVAGKSVEEMEATPATSNMFVLMDLQRYTVYNIQVLAFNPAGDGPRSSFYKICTLEDIPGPPGPIVFSDITMSSVNVSWNPPEEPNGQIRGYLVLYETAIPNMEFSKQVKQKVMNTYLLVTGLAEKVSYSFSVRAETLGYGPPSSSNVTTGPQLGSPGAPLDLVLHHTHTSLTLSWHNGPQGAAGMTGYLLESKQTNEAWHPLVQLHNGPQDSYSVSFQNLLPATKYNFRLFSRNKFGISEPAKAPHVFSTPSKLFLEYKSKKPMYREVWFLVMLAFTSMIIIILVVAVLCVKSKAYKYKKESRKDTLREDHLNMEDAGFPSFELRQSKRGTLSKNSLTKKSNTMIAKAPPRPSPASVTYSDDDDVKGYDDPCDSSSLTEKPSEISSTDSQGSESEGEPAHEPHSFVNHYANVNDTLRQSWKRQRPVYTDSEPEGSVAVSLNGGHIIMNNMAGSRAPLPGFSSFV